MANFICFDNVKVEFLYPFKIAGWRSLRQYIVDHLDTRDKLSASDGGALTTDSFFETVAARDSSCAISNNLRFMETLSYDINRLRAKNDKLLGASCHRHEQRGTRPYCIKDEPFLIFSLKGEELSLLNPERLPDLQHHLPGSKIRTRASIKLMYSGFGIMMVKFHLMTFKAIETAVNDIVHSSIVNGWKTRTALAKELIAEMPAEIKYKDTSAILRVIDKFDLEPTGTEDLASKLCRLIEETTVVHEPLSIDDVIDLQNLDRGFDWGREPYFAWNGSMATGAHKLYHYFLYLLQKTVINRIQEAVATNSSYPHRAQLAANLSHHIDWHAADGEFPYILTTLAAPAAWRKKNSASLQDSANHMNKQLVKYQSEIASLLMKSKWKSIRNDWQPIKTSLNNVFYSDLLYMAVHLRGALSIYYLPADPEKEFKRSPELLGSAKYREEFKITLCDQRILWYIYTMQNQLISKDMEDIVKHYEDLRNMNREAKFTEIFDGLSHIVTTIENRKVALAEVMEDPLSRRGGSSLFSEMIDSSSQAFRLRELYDSLKHKLERLDMLGIHVSEGIHEASNLIVSESSRGAQITLEILESVILGVYAAEVTEFAAERYEKIYHKFPFPLDHWWAYVLVGVGTFLVALPWVTLIRKFRTRVPISEPPFQESIESMFATIGPIGLSIVIYLSTVGRFRFDFQTLLLTSSGAALAIGSWWFLTWRYAQQTKPIGLMGNLSRYNVSRKS